MRTRTRKLTACFFLIILSIETLVPGAAYALTSGPAQPEMQQFEPAGTGDLVDLFTGDLKYNIPLGDVGGYPLNLAYQSGTGMEEEAGWVGAGWSLNPGAITRDMRGLPDDFNGAEDKVTKHYRRKEFTKIGGQIVLKPSILAWEFGSASIKMGVYRDNYYGMGAEIGASLGFQLAKNKKTSLTAGLDISSDSREGTSITPSLSLSRSNDFWRDEASRSLSGSLTYNTRSGLKQVQLDASFSSAKKWRNIRGMDFSAASYFGQSYTPSITNNTSNTGFTFSFDGGPSIWGGYVGIGGSGYFYKEDIVSPVTSAPAYGYMNYLNGRKNKQALLDFNREKDGVFITSTPAIAIPVATPDLFVATSQAGSQQFRPFFGGNYIVFDQAHYNNTFNLKGGVTVGAGNVFKGGARIDFTTGGANTNKWVDNNAYLSVGEPDYNQAAKPSEEPIYFKPVGEQTEAERAFLGPHWIEETQQVGINDPGHVFAKAKAFNALKSREHGWQTIDPANPLKKPSREKRTTAISYLTAAQAKKYGLDKTINGEVRDGGYRKPNHLSEMTITDQEGKRMVYGIPVYNRTQEEVTFSVAPPANPAEATRTGLVSYESETDGTPKYKNGRDQLYSKDIIPAYATSFLLTGILSPDYVDQTGNGITDDDLGTAVKFNYTKHTDNYRWRAPYAFEKAHYNEGFNIDNKDDKGSYTYGIKEVWYVSSIESKTMIAFFETSERKDGMGVTDERGGRGGVKLKKLDKIKIYSKADWAKNGGSGTAVPVKTIHFEYDYSLCPEVPNNSTEEVNAPDPQNPNNTINLNAAKGKLTLKKVYFTFGNNNRGKSNPYEFFYDVRLISTVAGVSFPASPTHPTDIKEKEDQYTERQQDRWGTYKHSRHNRLVGGEVKMNNSEYPYTLQDNVHTSIDERDLTNRFASKWQLNKIITPTGSTLEAEYEADEYAYVQNRRAMQMCFVKGIGNVTGTSDVGLNDANGITIELPVSVPNVTEFKRMYLQGPEGKLMDKILYKVSTDIAKKGAYEYVQGYAELDLQNISVSGNTAFIGLKKVNGKNPVAKAAWQMLKADLPQFAYDNYDNSDATSIGANYIAAIKSMVTAFINQRELFTPFEKIADKKDFADKVDLNKSMVRLYSPLGKKLGGGSRVKKLLIRDNWQDMTAGGSTASFGQRYDYLTKDATDHEISSGVAAYEPSIGNEENPFHEPVPYTEKVHWSVDRYHYMEKPYCETYFPAPSVGYSKVTVTAFGDDYVQSGTLTKHTGYIENEFYTARDFPTLVDNLPLEQNNYENNLILKLFSSTSVKRVVTSQGFKVELNDMHGKSKSVKVFSKAGDMISSTETFYNLQKENAKEKELNNEVDVLKSDGFTKKALLGTDVDFVTDMRESKSESIGTSIGGYTGGMVIPFFIAPIYIPYGAINFNYSITTDSYHSTSSVKVIHRYGIVKKVRTMQNGSTSEAENLLWDGETGQVLLTRTQNEFNDDIYSFTYPAWMAQEGMLGAYKNIGNIFTNFSTNTSGVVMTTGYQSFLYPGDELASIDGDQRGWIIKTEGSLRFIDAMGEFIVTTGRYMTVRSGLRNLAGTSAGNIVSLKNPLVPVSGDVKKIELTVDNKILEASAVLYKDLWQVPVRPQYIPYLDCSSGGGPSTPNGICNCACLKSFFDYLLNTNQLFIQQSQNLSVGQLVTAANNAGYNVGTCPILDLNAKRPFYAVTNNAVASVYTANVGDCRISIRSDNGSPVSFYGLKSQPCNAEGIVKYSNAGPQYSNTYYTSCSRTERTFLSTIYSSPKMTTGYKATNGTFNFASTTGFKIEGLLGIPANAVVTSANFFLYAASEGYDPPSYPNPHTPVSETNGVSPFRFYTVKLPWLSCSEDVPNGFQAYVDVPGLTTNSQDVVVDFRNLIDAVRTNQENYGFSFRTNFVASPTVTETKYATFASENYPIAAKRPRLEVTYTIPPPVLEQATLQIDECISCPDPLNRVINPYYAGLLGNWRAEKSFVYTVNREQKPGLVGQNGGTNIRKSGYFASFDPFWLFQPAGSIITSIQVNSELPAQRWAWKDQPVYFDLKGNAVETVDPLKRYSSVLFGYLESVPIAMAANARRNEIAYDGFEDYYFTLQNDQQEKCVSQRHFDWGLTKQSNNWTGPGGAISTDRAHTGKYSYKLSGNTTITRTAGNSAPITTDFLGFDNNRYKLLNNELADGFRPVSGKKYILSLWVYDGALNSNKVTGLDVMINGQNRFVSTVDGRQYYINEIQYVPVIEGWKRLELVFTSGSNFNMQLIPTGNNIYVDDIRVLPFDAKFTSNVYDDRTMRLTAQLDENNVATFYEYDDEGTPIRVKKETENGIKTIKENRQFYRKRNP